MMTLSERFLDRLDGRELKDNVLIGDAAIGGGVLEAKVHCTSRVFDDECGPAAPVMLGARVVRPDGLRDEDSAPDARRRVER